MRKALAATVVFLSLGATVFFLMHEEVALTHPEVIDGTVAAATASAGAAESGAAAGGARESEPLPVPIQVSPFREERERPEKLLVRIVTGVAGQEKPMLAADVRFETGRTRQLGAEVLEDRQTVRRTLSNRWGEASFDMPRSGIWWLEVTKDGRRTSVQGSAEEVQNGILVVRVAQACALRVTLAGVTERVEVEAGWSTISESMQLPVAMDALSADAREYLPCAPAFVRFTAGPGEPVLLHPEAGQRLLVEVKSVQGAFTGWVDVPALVAGEARDITLPVKRCCVLSAKLPAHWPGAAEVEACCERVGKSGWCTVEQQKCRGSDELRFLLPESAHYAVKAMYRTPDSASCSFKALDVDVEAGAIDVGVLEAGPTSVNVRLHVAEDLQAPRDTVLALQANASSQSDGDLGGWSLAHSFQMRSLEAFQIHGLPAGFEFEASLRPSHSMLLRVQNREPAVREPWPRAGSRRTALNSAESESDRMERLRSQCEWPSKGLVLAAGMNTMDLALKRKPPEQRPSRLALNIAPPPANAWSDNGYSVRYRTQNSRGSSGFPRGEGAWTRWFPAGINEVEVLVLCGDHVIGPRTIQLNPGGEAEVSLGAWQSRDDAEVSAAVDRFAPPLPTTSLQSGK